MEGVFNACGILELIVEFNCTLNYKYDPPTRSHRIKTFSGLVKNSHLRVLNHELQSLKCDGMGADKEFSFRVSDNYCLGSSPTFKMIATMHDLTNTER